MSQIEQNTKEKKSFAEGLSTFIVCFRVPILSVVAVLIIAAVAFGVWTAVSNNRVKKSLSEIDIITNELSEARASLSGDELKVKENAVYEKALAIAEKETVGVSKIRAYMLMAEVKYAANDWNAARDAWVKAAELNQKAYTYALCCYQAAVCSEELKDFDNAVSYFKKAVSDDSFPVKPRALFSIGRIEEQRGNYAAAQESYQSVVSSYPNDQWAFLAKSRLIQLAADGRI